jgi:hypothetical protein
VAYDNNSDKVTFITKTGAEIATGYNGVANTVDVSSLLDINSTLSTSIPDADELVVVRKFAHSTIDDSDYTHASSPVTADEAWSAWTLPDSNDSGSTMYTISDGIITFSTTAADYVWTTTMSGRAADITVPTIASGDTIYILRKTFNLTQLVTWTSGSKITSNNLNQATEQMLFLTQELMGMMQNIHKFNPAYGQPSGIATLDSAGALSQLTAGDGISKSGTTVAVDLATNSGLAISSEKLKADTVDSLVSTDAYKPLSANQGKLLDDKITLIGTAIVYKGSFNLNTTTEVVAVGTDSPSAGFTVTQSTTGTAHATWTGLSGSITAGSLIRFGGTNWEVVAAVTGILADGSVALTANWAAGAYEISSTATKPTGGAGALTDGTEKRYATLEFVEDEIAGTKLSDLGDVLKGSATATIIGTAALDDEDGTNFILTNTDGTTVTLHTDDDKNFGDTSSDGGTNTWELNTRDIEGGSEVRKATQALWIACKAAIDAEELKMTIDPTTVDTIADGSQVNFTLTQNIAGTAGNTAITSITGVTAPSAFTGGSVGTAAVAGDMVYYDGNTWEVIALENSFTSGEKVISTGSSMASLADVGTAASGSGDNAKALVWNGSTELWEPTTVSSLTPTIVVCGGVGDGAADESGNVNTALNDSTLGYEGTAPVATTLNTLDFRSRKHKCGTGSAVGTTIKIPGKKNVTVRNGHLVYSNSTSAGHTLIATDTVRTTVTTATASDYNYGSRFITVDDSTGFVAGDMVELEALTADDTNQIWNQSGADGAERYAMQLVVIDRIDGVIWYLEEPLKYDFAVDTVVNRYDIESNGTDFQPVNWLWENMTFEHALSQEMICANNKITCILSSGATAKVTVPAGHGVTGTTAQMILIDHDLSVSSEGADFLADGDHINDLTTTITSVTGTNDLNFTLGASWLDNNINDTDTGGGTFGRVITFQDRALDFSHVRKFTFRNCTFDGFRGHAVKLTRCKDILFENCTFKNCRWGSSRGAGIYINECDGIIIRDCVFDNCTNGIKSADSNNMANASIRVEGCTFRCLQAINLKTPIMGDNVIRNCIFEPIPWNEERADVGYSGNNSAANDRNLWADIVFSGINCIIEGNTIGAVRIQPEEGALVETAFWDAGTGYVKGGRTNSGEKCAITYENILIYAAGNNEDTTDTDNRAVGQGITIRNNQMVSQVYNIRVILNRNTRYSRGTIRNLSIDNNKMDGAYGIHIGCEDDDSINILLDGVTIDHNHAHIIHSFEDKPGHSSMSTDSWIRMIWLKTFKATFSRGSLSHNSANTPIENQGNGFLLGMNTPKAPKNTMPSWTMIGNRTRGFAVGFFFYKSSTTSMTQFNHSLLTMDNNT